LVSNIKGGKLTEDVFLNRVLRRIFGRRRDEVTGEWGQLHNEKVCDLYSSSSILIIIKSRWMRWAGPCSTKGVEEEGV
jgi:hypothetical protein